MPLAPRVRAHGEPSKPPMCWSVHAMPRSSQMARKAVAGSGAWK